MTVTDMTVTIINCYRNKLLVTLRFIPDASMPADFLTKWIPAAKFKASITYATNSHASGVLNH